MKTAAAKARHAGNADRLLLDTLTLDCLGRALPFGVFIADANGLVYANERVSEILQQPLGKLLGPLNMDLVHPDDRALVRSWRKDITQPVDSEFRILARGAVKWVRARSEPFVLPGGRRRGRIGTLEDITLRKGVEEALRQDSDLRFRLLFAEATVATAVVSPDGRLQQANAAWCELLGYAERELEGRRIEDLTYPGDLLETAERMSGPFERLRGVEKRYLHKSGRPVWAEINAALVKDAAGRPAFTIVQAVDIRKRKQMEEELRRRERAYRALADNAPDLVARFDRGLRHVYINPVIEPLTGLPPAAFIGKTNRELGMPADLDERWCAALREVLRSGRPGLIEFEFPSPDGARVLQSHIAPEFGADGAVEFAVAVTRDITRRVRAEEALRAAEELYRATVDSIDEAIHVVDADLRLVLMNETFRRWCDRYGLPRADKGVRIVDLFAFLPQTVWEEYRRVLESGETVVTDESVEFDGRRVCTRTRKVPLLEGGRVARVLTIVQDITEQKRAEAALRASEEKYRRLHESMTDAYVKVSMDGRILEWNAAYQTMLGYSDEELKRLIYQDLTPSRWHALEAEIVNGQILPKGYSEVYEKEYRRKDGTVLPVELRNFLLRGDDGAPQAMWAIVRDISERKRAEALLRQARDDLERRVLERTAQLRALAVRLARAEEEERQRIAGILHDDLQQIIVGARFALNGLRGEQSAAERERAVARVDECLETAHRVMRSLGRELYPAPWREQGLAAALEGVARDARERFGLEVDLEVDLAQEPQAAGLRGFVLQAVRELLFNAAKHAGPCRVQVSAKPLDEQRLRIEVQDSGRGFDPARIEPSAFGLFGLRERCEHLGGELAVESAPGRGTRATLTLPWP